MLRHFAFNNEIEAFIHFRFRQGPRRNRGDLQAISNRINIAPHQHHPRT